MREKRQYARQSIHATATISHPHFSMSVKVVDISSGGIAVDMSHYTHPPIGTLVNVVIKRLTGVISTEPHNMRVAHTQANGLVGLAFV